MYAWCAVQNLATESVPPIMEALFECTLEMINKNLEEFPEHRIHFFRMLQAITTHCFSGNWVVCLFVFYLFICLFIVVCLLFCFPAYLQIPAPQFKVLMDSVVWAFKHTMRNVAEIGLNILLSLLQKFAANEEAGTQFFNTYFLDLMQHIFSVVTDTSHTASKFLAL